MGERDPLQRGATIALGASLLLLAAISALKKIRNPDYWWHLSAGHWIWEHRQVPHADVFTYTVPGAPWIDIHWLFQLALAGVHALGGHEGVILVKAALAALLVAALASVGWRGDRPFVAGLALGTMLLIASERFLVRPEMLSFLLLAGVLALLERSERRDDGWVFAVLPLQLVWVNVHGLYALGIALCGFYLAGAAVRGERSRRNRLALLLVLVTLASLANPNTLQGALYPFEQLLMISPLGDRGEPGRNVFELNPLWTMPPRWLVLPALLAAAAFAALALSWRHGRSRVAHLLALGAFVALALQANRNLALFALVAAPITVRNVNEILDRRPPAPRLRLGLSAAATALLLAACVDVWRGSYYERLPTTHENGLGVVDIFAPEGAADWIERERPPGPIAHQMAVGGYLGWRLLPDYEVMMDGRLEVFGFRKLAELEFRTPRAFRRLDAEYRFGSVVLSPFYDPPRFTAWLAQQPEWQLVHADPAGLLFVRRAPDGSSPWQDVDLGAPDLLPPLTVDGTMDRARRKARIRMLMGLGLVEAARAEAELVDDP